MLTELGEIPFVFIPMAKNQRVVDYCRWRGDVSRRCWSIGKVHSSVRETRRIDMVRRGEIISTSILPTCNWCSRFLVITTGLGKNRTDELPIGMENEELFTFQDFAEGFLVGRKCTQRRLEIHRCVIGFARLSYLVFETNVVQHVGFPVRSIETATTFMRLVQRSIGKVRMMWRGDLTSGIRVSVRSSTDLFVGKCLQMMFICSALITGWFF